MAGGWFHFKTSLRIPKAKDFWCSEGPSLGLLTHLHDASRIVGDGAKHVHRQHEDDLNMGDGHREFSWDWLIWNLHQTVTCLGLLAHLLRFGG